MYKFISIAGVLNFSNFPNYEMRGDCQICNEENMDHILTEYEASGQEQPKVWKLGIGKRLKS